MSEKDDIRSKIIEAARKRFSHFGYGKTTMAEVAADCAMSPGNLYRFFQGKLDIAEAIATKEYEAHLATLRKLAHEAAKTTKQRLHDLLFAELRRTYHKLEKEPRAFELASVIRTERPEFAKWLLSNEREILVELLDESEKRGEFEFKDKKYIAEMILSATMKFRYPQIWSKLTLPELERELEGVLNLLANGICPDARAKPQEAAA